MLHNVLNGVYKEEVIYALNYTRQALKSHTCVDIGMFKRSVVALAVVVELGKYEVPDLDEAVALAANVTVGLAAAFFGTAVKVNFGAGTART